MLNLVPVVEMNLIDVPIGKYVFVNHTYFVRENYNGDRITLRCVIANPQYGYGEGSLVSLDASTAVSLAEEPWG